MANVYKSPAQLVPAANTLSTLYTVPSNTQVVTSNIHVCNSGSSIATVRIAVRPNGEAIAPKHYLFFGLTKSIFCQIINSGIIGCSTIKGTLLSKNVFSIISLS
jgi:hypothetical protein